MRYLMPLFLFALVFALSSCSVVHSVFGGGDETPETNGDLPVVDTNNPNNGDTNLIPNRPAGNNLGSPERTAIDNTAIIPGRPWERFNRGNPNEIAGNRSQDSAMELLNFLTSKSVKDSTPPWYNRWTESVSDTVEDINMGYKRLLPPLNPGR